MGAGEQLGAADPIGQGHLFRAMGVLPGEAVMAQVLRPGGGGLC